MAKYHFRRFAQFQERLAESDRGKLAKYYPFSFAATYPLESGSIFFNHCKQERQKSSLVRTPRGRDIMAACGQLKSASERARKTSLPPFSL